MSEEILSNAAQINVLEEEMMKIREYNNSLHVYYVQLNQALHVILSKIEMTHKNKNVANALTKEIHSIACTMQHDSHYHQLEYT